ncbi:hypothetical protein GQ53DRAFT_743699, partial [Thozetella sp. PMI_491]
MSPFFFTFHQLFFFVFVLVLPLLVPFRLEVQLSVGPFDSLADFGRPLPRLGGV